ncbi:UNVERIFIED_CONTAM: hypothetical protein NY100_21550, partial [Prevotella sp. 15_C9]
QASSLPTDRSSIVLLGELFEEIEQLVSASSTATSVKSTAFCRHFSGTAILIASVLHSIK